MLQRFIGYSLMATALMVLGGILYAHSTARTVPLIFSPIQVLQSTWLTYKDRYIEKHTYRTVDPSRNNMTTSEGQAYTMLRAAWMGDKETFDGAWSWTKNNIAHQNDHLFSWAWGELPQGTYGVLPALQGKNSASDADTDIATALLFAYGRWQDPAYLTSAQGVMQDIWDKEVLVVHGTPYLLADDIEKTTSGPDALVNPSYLSPAAYRLFAQVDLSHPWGKLVDSSYTLLTQVSAAPLGTSTSAGLPPNWVRINKTTGAITGTMPPYGNTNFSYDALRVPWRVALDEQWSGDPRAQKVLSQFSFLASQWKESGKVASEYDHSGAVLGASESPAMYGGIIGYFSVADPADSKNVYEQKLLSLYNPGANTWKEPLSYYDDNWAWFGIGLYNHLLPNLAARIPKQVVVVR